MEKGNFDKNTYLYRLNYVLVFIIGTLALEIAAFISLNFGYLPKYIFFDVAFILVYSAVLYLVSNDTARFVLVIIAFSVQFLLNSINVCYYKMLGDIFSFDLLKLGNEAAKCFELDFLDYKGLAINIITLILSILTLVYVFKRRNRIKLKPIKKSFWSSFAIILAIFFCFSGTGIGSQLVAESLLDDCEATDAFYIAKSDTYLYDHFTFKAEAFKKFGTWGFYIKSVDNIISPKEKLTSSEMQELEDYLQSGVVAENTSAPLYGQNLITIMLESFEWFAIDPYLTPTLYEMKTSTAQAFTNFRAKNKTNVSENLAMMGNIPKDYTFMNLSKGDFSPSNSLAYMFKQKGYTANFFHNNDGDFYDRNNVNTRFGFEKVYAMQDVNNGKICEWGDWHLETDFFEELKTIIAPTDQNFYSFYTTVETHGPHTKLNPRLSEYFEIYDNNLENIKQWLEDEGYQYPSDKIYQTRLKQFKCAAMDTDRLVKNIIDYLTENNLIDTTTIILYSDHNCYYNDLNLMVRYGGKEYDTESSEVHNIPFMIYSKTLGGAVNDTFCSTYDIYPTICELFGLSYNKNLTQGYNIYSSEIDKTVFVSLLTGAIFTDNIYSYNIQDVYTKDTMTEEEIYNFQLGGIEFYEKQYTIDKIYANGLLNVKGK